MSRIPDVAARLALTEREIGLALFGVAFGAICTMPAVAPAVRRVGSRRVCRAAAVAFAASLPLLRAAWDLLTLTVALVLFGATNGGLDVNDDDGRLERALARPVTGSLHAAFSCGAATGALAGAGVAALGVPAGAHFAAAAAVLVVAAVRVNRHLADPADPPAAAIHAARPRPSAALLLLLLVGLCATLAEGAVSDWSALYLVDTLGTSPAVSATGFVAFCALMALGRLTQDHLVHRFGETVLRRAGAALAATGLTLALLTDRPGVAAPALGVVGLGLAVVFPLTMSAASRLPRVAPASAVAAVSTIAYAALLAGPPLIGILAKATTLRAALWVVSGALVLIAALPAPRGLPAVEPAPDC